jgi:hypothetical protein
LAIKLIDDEVDEVDLVGGELGAVKISAECSTAASRSKPISDRTNRPSPWDRSLASSMPEAAPVPLSMSMCSSAARSSVLSGLSRRGRCSARWS